MKPEDMRESMGEEWYARAKQIEAEADLQAALSTISTQAARIKELERALLAAEIGFRTIAEYPIPEQDNIPAANMRQIARREGRHLRALTGGNTP